MAEFDRIQVSLLRGCKFEQKHNNNNVSKPNLFSKNDNVKTEMENELSFFSTNQLPSLETTTTPTPSQKKETPQITTKRSFDEIKSQMKIHTKGTHVPAPILEFSEMSGGKTELKNIIVKHMNGSGFQGPTAIQMQAIPAVLKGRDVMAISPTGTGKSLAFLIPILLRASNETSLHVHSIILSPSALLAKQTYTEAVRISEGYPISIGLLTSETTSNGNEKRSNHKILVATLETLVAAIASDKDAFFDTVQTLCFDEADSYFDLESILHLDKILETCNSGSIQRVMISATLAENVKEIMNTILRDPIQITVDDKNSGANNIFQQLKFVGKERGKIFALRQLVQDGFDVPALIFVKSPQRVKLLQHELSLLGVPSGVAHEHQHDEERNDIVEQFRMGTVSTLICTDIISRGIDFKGINLVVNYDMPMNAVTYVHRIGRTGRCGRAGTSVTYFTERDMSFLRKVASVLKMSGSEVDAWMFRLKSYGTGRKNKKRKKKTE